MNGSRLAADLSINNDMTMVETIFFDPKIGREELLHVSITKQYRGSGDGRRKPDGRLDVGACLVIDRRQ